MGRARPSGPFGQHYATNFSSLWKDARRPDNYIRPFMGRLTQPSLTGKPKAHEIPAVAREAGAGSTLLCAHPDDRSTAAAAAAVRSLSPQAQSTAAPDAMSPPPPCSAPPSRLLPNLTLYSRRTVAAATLSSLAGGSRRPLRYAVLGAGFAGLSVAWHLLKVPSSPLRPSSSLLLR